MGDCFHASIILYSSAVVFQECIIAWPRRSILVVIPLFLRMTRYIDIKYSPYMQSVYIRIVRSRKYL